MTQPVAARVVVAGLVTAPSALRVDGPHGPKVLKVLKFDGPTGRGLVSLLRGDEFYMPLARRWLASFNSFKTPLMIKPNNRALGAMENKQTGPAARWKYTPIPLRGLPRRGKF